MNTTLSLSRNKLLFFSAVILIFLLLLAEYICHWEEKLSFAGRPSILAYQQIPTRLFVEQTTANGKKVIRTAGLTHSYQAVPTPKPAGELRIGVLGASAVAGMGYSPTWSFPGILQQLCDKAGINARVINLGRTGYASRQLVSVASKAIELLQLDSLILYSGNNEFLEVNARLTRGENLVGYSSRAKGWLSKSALYRTLYRLIFAVHSSPDPAGMMVQKTLPLPMGVQGVVRREFTNNLLDIAQLARDRCRLVLCTVPVNLSFGPTGLEPFFLDPQGDEKWQALFAAFALERMGRPDRAASEYGKALAAAPEEEQPAISLLCLPPEEKRKQAEEILRKLDGTRPDSLNQTELFTIALACHATGDWTEFLPFEALLLRKSAGTYEGTFAKGRIELLKDRQATARTLLSSARNLDDRRIRILSDFNDAIRTLAAAHALDLLELETECWDYGHFNDYCHFNLDGNLLTAQKIFAHLFSRNPPDIGMPAQWLAGRERDFPAPGRWLGVDDAIWKVYTQRPGSLSEMTKTPGDLIEAGFWRANRLYFTWGGDNPEVFNTIENQYRSGLGTGFDSEAKAALEYLMKAEGITNP